MDLLDLHAGRPAHRGALTLFPVWNGRAVAARGYALAAGSVEVSERAGSPVVEQLVVGNPTARPALVLDGDLLQGGQQHRVARRSVMVPAHSSLVLDVLCVEAGRWSGGSAPRAGGRRAPVEVRAALITGQQAVWDRVDGYGARFGRNATGSLLEVADRAEMDGRALVSGLRPLPGQCGLLIGLGGQPLLLEVVDSPRTLAALWGPLLRSVALDALDAAVLPTPGRRARRFLDRVQQAQLHPTGDAGEGSGVLSTSPYARLQGLVWRDRVVVVSALNARHELVAV